MYWGVPEAMCEQIPRITNDRIPEGCPGEIYEDPSEIFEEIPSTEISSEISPKDPSEIPQRFLSGISPSVPSEGPPKIPGGTPVEP